MQFQQSHTPPLQTYQVTKDSEATRAATHTYGCPPPNPTAPQP